MQVNSENHLAEIAHEFSKKLKSGDWIRLEGELGAGKTTFIRKVLMALGYIDPVVSPTYPLLVEYEVEGQRIIHIDGFRLSPGQGMPWDFHEWSDAIVFVEWPEKTSLPQDRFRYTIRLSPGSATESRNLEIVEHT